MTRPIILQHCPTAHFAKHRNGKKLWSSLHRTFPVSVNFRSLHTLLYFDVCVGMCSSVLSDAFGLSWRCFSVSFFCREIVCNLLTSFTFLSMAKCVRCCGCCGHDVCLNVWILWIAQWILTNFFKCWGLISHFIKIHMPGTVLWCLSLVWHIKWLLSTLYVYFFLSHNWQLAWDNNKTWERFD